MRKHRKPVSSYALPHTVIHRRRMVGVRPLGQATKGSCGLASLSMVLAKFGIRKSEKALAKLSGASRRSGSTELELMRATRRLGMHAQHRKRVTFRELKVYLTKGIPAIVAWWKIEESHFSVVVDVDRENITLADPEIKRFIRIPRQSFRRIWFGFTGENTVEQRDATIIIPGTSPPRR